jgi:sarcosine oxidase
MAYDVIVIGLGVMGSASLSTLAKRGRRVLGIDRYAPPHSHGSSHGLSRIIREGYWEHPLYVPLVRRAYQLWQELERDSAGQRLLVKTGGLIMGHRDGALVTGALESVVQYRIPHELLSAAHLHRRFQAYAPLDDWVGVYELRAGVLQPEKIITAYHELAGRHGAEIRVDENVLSVDVANGVVKVTTSRSIYEAAQAIVSVGPWAPQLLKELSLPLMVERQVSHWFEPADYDEYFRPDQMPVAICEIKPDQIFYAIPDLGDGVKVGIHHSGEPTTIDTVNRTVSDHENAVATDLLRRFLPFAKGRLRAATTCLYTNTPDGHFIVDRHPGHPELLVMSPCSGHGFKFAGVLAEAAADMVQGIAPRFDLTPFSLSRFAASGEARPHWLRVAESECPDIHT